MTKGSDSEIKRLRDLCSELASTTRESFSAVQSHLRDIPDRAKGAAILFPGSGQGAHNIGIWRNQGSIKKRLVSGPIIAGKRGAVWIDPGPDCLEAISRVDIDPRHINAILVSHAHVDHTSNCLAAVELITGGTEIRSEKQMFGNQTSMEGDQWSPKIIGAYHAKKVLKEARTLQVGDNVSFQDIEVTAIPCHHRESDIADCSLNWRFRLLLPERTIDICLVDGNLFVPDSLGGPSDELFSDVVSACKGAEAIIANVSNHVRMQSSRQNYLSTKGTLTLLRLTRPAAAVLTHFGIEMSNPSAREKALLNEAGFSDLVAFQQYYLQAELEHDGIDCNVIAAHDGMRIPIEGSTLKLPASGFGVI